MQRFCCDMYSIWVFSQQIASMSSSDSRNSDASVKSIGWPEAIDVFFRCKCMEIGSWKAGQDHFNNIIRNPKQGEIFHHAIR